jgi:large subunit ribosomal protein L29
MELEEMRGLSDAELAQEIVNQHEEWRNLRFQNALGRLTTFHQLSQVRKTIARLKTIQQERTMNADLVAYFAGNAQIRARRRAEKAEEKVAKRKYARAQAGRTTRRRRY